MVVSCMCIITRLSVMRYKANAEPLIYQLVFVVKRNAIDRKSLLHINGTKCSQRNAIISVHHHISINIL
ncbi:hypothetical protein T4B_3069 [Trichinella pseudospiralis]|uniref:Uncharacterized protein n=1 Tax=Trichinella pseudospiralis TaxID=6337 RepID=A0A0V1H3U4_TRIPS|nr:hypothetical protein T4B_3069 [Trichinella pseudospiralis]